MFFFNNAKVHFSRKQLKFIRRTPIFSRRVFLLWLEIDLPCNFQKLKNDPKIIATPFPLDSTCNCASTLGSYGLSGRIAAGISLLPLYFILAAACHILLECQLSLTSHS